MHHFFFRQAVRGGSFDPKMLLIKESWRQQPLFWRLLQQSALRLQCTIRSSQQSYGSSILYGCRAQTLIQNNPTDELPPVVVWMGRSHYCKSPLTAYRKPKDARIFALHAIPQETIQTLWKCSGPKLEIQKMGAVLLLFSILPVLGREWCGKLLSNATHLWGLWFITVESIPHQSPSKFEHENRYCSTYVCQ